MPSPIKWEVGDCVYSIEALKAILTLSNDPILTGYVNSQINNYYINCNIYVKSIERALERLGI